MNDTPWLSIFYLVAVLTLIVLMVSGCGASFVRLPSGIEAVDESTYGINLNHIDLVAHLVEAEYGRPFEWDKLRLEVKDRILDCVEEGPDGKCRRWWELKGRFRRNGVIEPHGKGVRIRHLMEVAVDETDPAKCLSDTALVHEIEHWYLFDEGAHPKARGARGSQEFLDSTHGHPFDESRIARVNARVAEACAGHGDTSTEEGTNHE